jgi:putative phage-type endonuclease
MEAAEQKRYEAWIEDRRHHVTGTDVAAILGLSPWAGPMEVWLDKRGELPHAENDAMRAGKFLQDGILAAYSELNSIPLVNADPWKLELVPGCELLGASLDARWKFGDARPVDAKNIRVRGKDYGEEGSDRIPVYYQTQLAVQMMATGAPYADLAVCFGGQEFARFTVERDPDIEAAIKEQTDSWWKRHVTGGEIPQADGSDSCTRYIKDRFTKAELGRVVEPTEEIIALVAERGRQADIEAGAKAAKTAAENRIKAFMGDASEIRGLATCKNNRDSVKVDWQAVAETFKGDALYEDAVLRNTETKPGARVLRIK